MRIDIKADTLHYGNIRQYEVYIIPTLRIVVSSSERTSRVGIDLLLLSFKVGVHVSFNKHRNRNGVHK